jgi:two-component system, chemotaxis family, protein-glutamate methylesterase/glutaminase
MAKRNIVVIGASAGGIEALQQFLGALPKDLDAAVLIVLHTSNHADSLLPAIMGRVCPLPVIHPEDGARIQRGRVYIAPPDFHMIVEGDLLRLIQGPRENLHRPAIDPLFRSAAASHGKKVIGVILTGSLDDGTAGLMVVRARGGEAVIQEPLSAMFSSMPKSALEQVPDAHVLPLEEIPGLIVRLTREEIEDGTDIAAREDSLPVHETRISEFDMSEIENEDRPGRPSAFACPDCGGVLWEIEDSGFLRFRCRVGHAFTARHLGAEQRHAVETALWSALRALEESASLYRRLAERATDAYHELTAQRYEERASNTTTNARVLREFLIQVNQGEEERYATEQQVQ